MKEIIFRIGDDCADGVLLMAFCRGKDNGGVTYGIDSLDLNAIDWDCGKPNIVELGNVEHDDEEVSE